MNAVKMGWGAALCLALTAAQGARAEAPETAMQTMIDRAQIEDLVTRYYADLGHSEPAHLGQFYAEGAEVVLGSKTFKGREQIEGLYKSMPADIPQRTSFAFNVLLSNPLIAVHGDTASARLIYTEVIVEKEGDAPRILTQGREFDRLVKQDGEWRFSQRQIMGPNGTPEGWTD